MALGQEFLGPILSRVGTTARLGDTIAPAVVRRPPAEFLTGRVVSVSGQKFEVEIETGSLPGLRIGSILVIGSGMVMLEGAVMPTTLLVASKIQRFGDGALTRVECSRA